MKTGKRTFFVLLTMFLVVFAGCNSGSDSDSDSDPRSALFSVEIRTLDANGVDTILFSQGEQIVIELSIVNLLNAMQTAYLSDSGHPTFCIRRFDEQNCLWYSNYDRVFPQVLVNVQFQPHETRTSGAYSDQLANDGTAFGPGDYEVMSHFGFDTAGNQIQSAWHSFAILP